MIEPLFGHTKVTAGWSASDDETDPRRAANGA